MQDVVVEQASAKITRIEGQKKKKNRFSVYLDDAFAFGLNVATLAEFNLKEGDLLTDDRIADILRSEGKKQIKESAFRYLAGRAHSEKELRTKLRRKQYDETLIDQLANLERRTRSGGKDVIDHPHGCHDDVANVVAGVCQEIFKRRVVAGGLFRTRDDDNSDSAIMNRRLQMLRGDFD